MKRFSHKTWAWIFIIWLLVFIGIQFIRPQLETPPVTSVIQLPDSVQQVLVKSCFDCHTSMTKFSWFDQISPASWVVSDHVREGRKHVNFSQWNRLTKDQQKVVLFESLNQMQFQVMPLSQYTFVHRSAKLNQFELNIFKSYVASLVSPILPDTTRVRLGNEQYASWIAGNNSVKEVKLSPNGIKYNPDYKNWVAISSTERFDNGTMRVIVGNDIAVKAAKEGHVNPWPDGSIIVKILWISVVDSTGEIYAGALRQLDFMEKDKKKYEETAGWGFGRWVNGLELKPYGKNELFTSECVHCHQSMQKNDFVFTVPIKLKSEVDLERKVIASSIDQTRGTMSTLYGNNEAVEYARAHADDQYPRGSELMLATWKQKEDDHWFGARIPSERQIIEKVHVRDSVSGKRYFEYERYAGSSWGKINGQNLEEVEARKKFMLKQRASVMP
jgi:Haem-binding domain/Cytochrome P460